MTRGAIAKRKGDGGMRSQHPRPCQAGWQGRGTPLELLGCGGCGGGFGGFGFLDGWREGKDGIGYVIVGYGIDGEDGDVVAVARSVFYRHFYAAEILVVFEDGGGVAIAAAPSGVECVADEQAIFLVVELFVGFAQLFTPLR